MRVCYFGTYRAEYARNRLMIERLRRQEIDVVECHASLWRGMEDREQVAGAGWRRPAFWWRVFCAYASLLWRYWHVGKYDVLMAGYPGQLDVPVGRILSWLRRKPLVWDVMMSIYLITLERGIDQKHPTSARLLKSLEQFSLRLPDMLIMDTQEYADWFQETYSVPKERIRLIPLGADDRLFTPLEMPSRDDDRFLCVYYGTFIRNHGVPTIIEAARLLVEDVSIHFELIGRGPERERVFSLAQSYHLDNVTFIDWMEETELVQHLASTDVCLGTFGITPQSMLTMQHKIHEGLATAKPIINGDSLVMRSTLKHGEHIYLCERENPQALAEAIRTLRENSELRQRIARQGYQYYRDNLSLDVTANQLKKHLSLLEKRRAPPEV